MTSSSNSNPSSSIKYDVFLSFRGEDTRRNFVDHLYAALQKHGITTFKDDDDDDFKHSSPSSSLFKAIEESRFAIVVFSKTYASSSWCLDELVHIMECSRKNGQFVLPVYYYDFSPSSLRRQGSVFGELFAKHEIEIVRAWTKALVEIANLSGLGLIDDRYQATCVKEIVETVSGKLNIKNISYRNNAMGRKREEIRDTASSHGQLVGMDRRVQQIKELLQARTVKNVSGPALAASSPRSYQWTYDVFMNFRGSDSCKDFADQLHLALEERSIYAFRNDQALAKGGSDHLKVIEESCVAVVIFSEMYAASSCCLDELVEIMNCNGRTGQMVFLVFYNVDSSDVRNQKGVFGDAFVQNKSEKVEIWRKALAKVCTLAGWYLNRTPKSEEPMLIESIVDVISRRLDRLSSSIDDNLIGLKAPVRHVMSLLKLESGGVDMLGICGMGGVGKTALAKSVYDQISARFDGSCFLENIREVSRYHDLNRIQRKLLSRLLKDESLDVDVVRSNYDGMEHAKKLVNRKVLLVLDDVDGNSQLEALLGFHKWFGDGSRIMITTRDETLLVAHNIMRTYYVEPLNDKESYQFLRRHAFKKGESTKGYEELFSQVISYAGGLPLALKVLSSGLCGRSKKEWTSTLARLQVSPEKKLLDTLKISYDGLEASEKELFLDIACFFNDTKKDYAVKILDSCRSSGETGIRALEQKSLISISKGRIKMHSLIEQMGRDMVRQERPNEPGKRSRVWVADDILIDSKEIDSIVVDDMHDYEYDTANMAKALKSMKNLRLLQIRSNNKLRFPDYFPKELRWLTLENPYITSLPTSFKGKELVGLELHCTNMSELWHGIKFMWKLRFLDLSYSTNLIKTPDFTGTPNLEELKLEYCTRLTEVHESIGYLERLSLVSFKSCRKLESLPQSFWKLKSLKSLNLRGCLRLKSRKLVLQYPSDSQTIKVPIASDLIKNRFWNLSLRSLKLQGSFHLHDTLVDLVQHSSSSPEGKKSQEAVEYKKDNRVENISL